MPVFLKYIEVENFKSFKGRCSIGPLKPFTAIIGRNGSGKSNLMDAISFVMGEKTSCLRVKKLSELIHGSLTGHPVKKRVFVRAVFQLEDGSEKSFMRSVQGSSSEHRINNTDVTSQIYLNNLKDLGINAKAKNFLVFQGAVESIAMKNPKERTALFEEISNSGALKADYERLKNEKLLAEEQTKSTFHDNKGFEAERKRAKAGKRQVEEYNRLKGECEKKQLELQLFRLFHIEKETADLEIARRKKQQEVNNASGEKKKVEEKLKEQKKESEKLERELQKIDQDIRELDVDISEKRRTFIKAKEQVAHMEKKVESARKSLATAQAADEAHKKDIKLLEDELSQVQQDKNVYNTTVLSQLQSQGKDVQLEDEQVREYYLLKVEAGKHSADFRRNLDDAIEKRKSFQDKLDNEKRRKTEVANEYEKKHLECDNMQKRIEKLKEHVETTKTVLEEKKKFRSDLQSDLKTAADEEKNLRLELLDICKQLGVAKVNQHEVFRNKKKAESVRNWKRLDPGVYDRMINMCQPIHKRFNVAITKVLGKYMEAIVVDTEKTARQCIQYLKEQYLEPETFLPLDYIQAKPLKGRLRNIQEPKNVKLLYDVLHFEPKDIDRAVLFATNNALVCETPEDANKVAYDMDKKTRYNCVALDGTYYQKTGIISGGNLNLERKAERWDENQISQLKSRKEEITDKLLEAAKKFHKESDLNTIDAEIAGLESCLKFNNMDLEQKQKVMERFETELKALQVELNLLEPKLNTVMSTISNRDEQIENMKKSINDLEDEVFASFCKQIKVRNIREYEESGLRLHRERENKVMEYDNHIDRITTLLDFEKQRDIKSNVERWRKFLKDAEDKLKTARQIEMHQLAEKDEDETKMNELLAIQTSKTIEVDQKEEETGRVRSEVGVISKKVLALLRELHSIESKIGQNKADRHTIFMHCKMEDIAIPLLSGNMVDIIETNSTVGGETISDSSLNTHQLYERESFIIIDFSSLPDNLKDMDENSIRCTMQEMNKVITYLQNSMQHIQIPTNNVSQRLQTVEEHHQGIKQELDGLRSTTKRLQLQFGQVKQERYNRFMSCFEHVANVIDTIYKTLTKNQSAQAILGLENPEEPYLDGIIYDCIVPGKQFQPMSDLSGGEKTIAALALLFAIHSFQQAPVFVLDEVDAALDNNNTRKLASYIRDKADSLQTMVISLKDIFYSHADTLIGICPVVCNNQRESNVLSFDLSVYPI